MNRFFTLFFMFFALQMQAQSALDGTCQQPLQVVPCAGDTIFFAHYAPHLLDSVKYWRVDTSLVPAYTHPDLVGVADSLVLVDTSYRELYIDIHVGAKPANVVSTSIVFELDAPSCPPPCRVLVAHLPVDSTLFCQHDSTQTSSVQSQPLVLDAANADTCLQLVRSNVRFAAVDTGLYRFAVEAHAQSTAQLRVSLISVIEDTLPAPPVNCLAEVMRMQLQQDSACPFVPFRSAKPFYQVELNGDTLATDDIITFRLDTLNRLCLTAFYKTDTGLGGLAGVHLHFGRSLTVQPIAEYLDTATGTMQWLPQPVMQPQPLWYSTPRDSLDGWYRTHIQPFQSSYLAAAPAAYQALDLRTSMFWLLNAPVYGDAIEQCPSGNCMSYKYCFEVQSNNNIPDSTKIVFAFLKADLWAAGGICRKAEGCFFDCGDGSRVPLFAGGADFLEIDDPAPHTSTLPDTTILPPPPLPLDLLSFSAAAGASNSVLLQWAVAREQAGDVYALQRSGDGSRWTDIATLPASGELRYTYRDAQAQWGDNYYRLKMRDAQGLDDYSPVRVVALGDAATTAAAVQLFPNPAKEQINVVLPAPAAISIELYDAYGRLAMQEKADDVQQLHRFFTHSLADGLYLLRITDSSTGRSLGALRLRKGR